MLANYNSFRQGFTLIEIMVVLAIIGLLAAAVGFGINDSSASSRDAKRQADLKNLQQAIETYKNQKGRYPDGCNGPGNWSGQLGSGYDCASLTGQYIIDLAPAYIPVLPVDPKLNTAVAKSGYMYVTNAEGSVYKIMAMNTVEADADLATLYGNVHPFRSCDIKAVIDATTGEVGGRAANQSICYTPSKGGGLLYATNEMQRCYHNGSDVEHRFAHSYGLWAGYSSGIVLDSDPVLNNAEKHSLKTTTDIICK